MLQASMLKIELQLVGDDKSAYYEQAAYIAEKIYFLVKNKVCHNHSYERLQIKIVVEIGRAHV